MDNIVLNFSNKLQKFSEKLGEVADVEWRLSREPVPYLEAVEIMEARVAAIADGKASELIWFLEHPSLYTAGTSAKATDLIDAARFPVYATGRGGQYTYHGPGQLVAYVMFDLNKRGRDVRRFVTALENWVIGALDSYGIRGERREGRPGIWVAGPESAGQHDEKIAALGVRVRRWITFHGVAINVCPDLSHFSGIVPCGISEAGVTSVAAQLHKMGKAVDADLA